MSHDTGISSATAQFSWRVVQLENVKLRKRLRDSYRVRRHIPNDDDADVATEESEDARRNGELA